MTFDRLVYVDRLKEAGVDERVARAHAEALRDALFETVATKADLSEVADRLDRKIDALDRKVDSVDHKIDLTARDLTIRGAGGLVLIASLLIGLKIFG